MVGRSSTSAGRPRVVHLVEALHGLVLVALAALQVMHGHGAAVVVNVVAALAVGEDLDPLDETGGVRSGRRQRVGGVRECGRPSRWLGEGAQRAGEILHVVLCGHVVSRDGKVTSRGTLCTEPSSCNTNHVERCIRTMPL